MSDFNNQENNNRQNGFEEREENGQPLAAFPVDISRDEFVRFNMLVSRQGGALSFQKSRYGFLLAFGVISLSMILVDIIYYNRVDPVNAMMLVFFAASSAIAAFSFSYRIKSAAENTYNLTLQSGQGYYGIVSVYPDRIEKRNDSGALVSLELPQASYIETREMMIISAPLKPYIVLPSRCLTPDDAEAVRRAVFAAVPVPRQRIISSFEPAAKEHIVRPETGAFELDKVEEDAITVDVSYTREEFVKIAVDSALRNYLKFLPFFSVMSLISALMLWLLFSFWVGIAAYVIFNAGLIGFNLYSAKTRSARLYDSLPQARLTACFTEDGITLKAAGGGQRAAVKWGSITRAVERPDSLDFYSKAIFIRIPKRCVGDLSGLLEFINSHYKKKNDQ